VPIENSLFICDDVSDSDWRGSAAFSDCDSGVDFLLDLLPDPFLVTI